MSPRRMQVLAVVIGLSIEMPIFLYLTHEVLERVGATELMWFLFWAYVPATVLTAVLYRIVGYRPCD